MNIREVLQNERIVATDLLSHVESCDLLLEGIEIEVLNLSRRSYNALGRGGIDNIGRLVCLTDADLAKLPNIGVTSLQEIVKNTNDYLRKIIQPLEIDRLFKTSLYELIQTGEGNVDFLTLTSLVSSSPDKVFLEPTPLCEIVTNDDLLSRLIRFGLSSSLDIWILAFGHHLKVNEVFTESLKEISQGVAGKWNVGKTAEFWTSVEAINISSITGARLGSTKSIPNNHFSCDYLKVRLVIQASPSSTIHWEALLPHKYLTQKIDWVHYDDKTVALCTLLKQSVNNSVTHWSDPSVEDWGKVPRSHAIDAFYSWIFSIKSRTFNRDYEIFKDWFGLTSGARKTLEEVGNKHNITRERVRQIVNRFIKLLLHPSRKKYLIPFICHFDMLFGKHGGIMTLKEIVNSCGFFEDFVGLSSLQAIELLLVGCNKYYTVDYHPIKEKLSNMELGWVTWYTSEINPEEIKRTRETAAKLVRNDPLSYNNDELVDLVSSIINKDKDIVRASLRTWRTIQDSRLGYSHLINGENRLTTSQMAIVALRELLVPARFSVIHKKISEIFPDQNVDIGTLRNTLNSGQFRIIGRGIYALLESGR